MQGRALPASGAETRRRALPWNDSSKPAQKPGPWDPPSQGERGATLDGAKAGPPPPSADAESPRRRGSLSPWGREETAEKAKPTRRAVSTGRKPADPKTAPSPRGPHLDELIRQVRAVTARTVLRPSGRGLRASLVGGVLAALAIAWGVGGVYEVGGDETGMVTRFGAFVGETGPGLHYHLPAPIEAVRQLPVGVPERIEVTSGGANAPGPMLTRDGQLAVVDYDVSWRIADPYRYLFQSAAPRVVLRDAAEAAVREAVGRLTFAALTSTDHGGVGAQASALLQAALRQDDLGLTSSGLLIADVQPPEGAQAGFRDMAAAREDAQVAARDVGAYRDRGLAAAQADTAKAVQASQVARDQEIADARGEAARFALIDAQYRKVPDVTRERLYTEMMERVLHNTPKVVVETPKGSAAQIVLPPDIFRAKAVPPPPEAAPAQAQPQEPAGQGSSQGSGQGPGDSHAGPTA